MSEDKNGSSERNTFKAYGLTISSCLHLPELLPGTRAHDVTIVYGDVPHELPDAKKYGVCFQAVAGQFLLEVPGIARYLVRGGNEIVIQRHAQAGDADVRLFLLGSVFGALLHQRGILALHGSTVKVDDGCVVFLGRSGIGKSTLAAALARRGYPVLGDDVCALSIGEDGEAYAAPAYPQAKLWVDSLQQLGIDPTGLSRIRPALEKRALPLETFADAERVPVKRFYVLSRERGVKDIAIIPITGPTRIRVLRDYTYRVEYMQGLNLTVPHFKKIAHLAARMPMARIFFPRHEFVIDELAKRVEDSFRCPKREPDPCTVVET